MTNTLATRTLDDFKFEAFLDEKFMRKDVDLIDAYITRIVDVKLISEVTSKLSKIYSFRIPFQFLKRIKKDKDDFQYLIGPIDLIDHDQLIGNLKELNLNVIERIKIPKYKPLTKKQLEFATNYWPCNFFEYKYVEKCLSGQSLFTDDYIASHLNRLIQLASDRRLCTTIIANKSEAIIESTSAIDQHFLYHSAFRAINLTAEKQLKFIKENSRNNIVFKDSKPVILPYLCTTYDVYSTNEPCVMCAMSLLHSRIKRLFYLNLDKFNLDIEHVDCMNDYAITKLQIHTKKGLNHHFEVFRVSLKD